MRGFAVVLSFVALCSVGGQVPTTAPRPTPPRNPADTARSIDSTRADSARSKVLIKWEDADSLTTSLLERKGYDITRYQGAKVTFNAKARTLYLEGAPAGVGRGATLLIGDTITYNDSTKVVLARGDTLILRDPSRGSADVVAIGAMTYNVESRRGTVTNISTSVESGETWYVFGAAAGFVNDTTAGRSTRFYAKNGSITSCDDSIPDYHFESKEIKLISKNLLVARPAVLYIGEVPVFWLPFIFQDMRSGRRSGLLTPRLGVNEIFRNSPSYRRHVDNIGYYFAFSDYMDAQVFMDWRSGAAGSEGDPGWFKVNGEWRYRWLDRFLTGRIGLSRLWQRDGDRNTAVSWQHQQDFSQASHLTADINYVTSTVLQRRNSFDPQAVLATIRSSASFAQQLGPASLSIGGSRVQYPGRKEVTQDFPNFSISTPTLSLGNRFDWTPQLSISNHEQLKVPRNGEFAYRVRANAAGLLDSTRLTSDARASTLSFSSPFKIFGFSLPFNLRINDQEDNSPTRTLVIDQTDPTRRFDRVFARRFSTEIDWSTGFSLPQFLPTTLKLSPSITIDNVDPHAYWVRTELSGGRYVHQSKRLSYGATMSPTFFGLLPGIGPVTRLRHTISPSIYYGYSPAAKVSSEYLAALNTDPSTYLGALASNRVTVTLSQVLEAKLKPKDSTSTEGRKIKLVGVNFSPVTYDFQRAKETGNSGFTTDNLSMAFNSDLLPNFAANVEYSLFQGNVQSDTSKFKPFRTGFNASFSINGNSGIFGALTRLLGRAVPTSNPQIDKLNPGSDDAMIQRLAATPVAGSTIRNQQSAIPPMQGWQASFIFSSTRQRPPSGNATVVEIDPSELCSPIQSNPIAYQLCLEQQSINPLGTQPLGTLTSGGPFFRYPARSTLQSNMGFHITPKWTSTWGTTYDFTESEFASHNVTLQRELHDWRAIFGFTRAPNGNFAFSFFIALNAQPDLKFDFNRQTYRETNRQ